MSSLLSLSKNKSATKGLKVNVVNTSNINFHKSKSNASKTSSNAIREEESMIPAVYASTIEETNETTSNEEEVLSLSNEVAALKLIIGVLQDNPFYINKFVVADDDVLMEIIKLLTNADDIVMDADDIGEGCITKKTYRKVNAIYVIKDGETKNLKYSYPNIVQELTELHISFKFVW